MNGNTKWVLLAVATALSLLGFQLKTDRDRIETTAIEARNIAQENKSGMAVANSRLTEIQKTLDEIQRDLKSHMRE